MFMSCFLYFLEDVTQDPSSWDSSPEPKLTSVCGPGLFCGGGAFRVGYYWIINGITFHICYYILC